MGSGPGSGFVLCSPLTLGHEDDHEDFAMGWCEGWWGSWGFSSGPPFAGHGAGHLARARRGELPSCATSWLLVATVGEEVA